MSEQQHVDPSGSTEQFRAFVQSTEPAGGDGRALPVGLLVGGGAIVVAAIVLLAWLVVG